ncbi:hypothetical protein FACS1894188_09880 [Clostridia bacterium]|nr:hypothetical protein FACS1894188_09880 [Clostridia bacterium]
MPDMVDRIIEVRKEVAKCNQIEFGIKINYSSGSVGGVEARIKKPSDRFIKAICREYNINEQWILTGDGEQNAEIEDDKNKKMINEICEDYNLDGVQKQIMYRICKLTEEQIHFIMQKTAEILTDELFQEKTQESNSKRRYDEDRKDAHRQLDANFDKLEQEKGTDKDFGTESAS